MTTFQTPIRIGSGAFKDGFNGAMTSAAPGLTGSGCDLGIVNVTQRATINFAAALVQDVKFLVPASATIVDVIVDVITAFDSTANTLSVGRTTGGTEIVSGVNAKATGRVRPTFTTTQLTNMNSVTTNTTLIATVTGTVTNPTVGSVIVTIVYAPN